MPQDYSYSLDKDSQLTNIGEAIKGKDYFCPCCGATMIPKQGKLRRWHFAHKGNTDNCSYETYLHKIAKKRICSCFNQSLKFTISYYPQVICAIKDCPLGASIPCSWHQRRTFDLKRFYNKCEEEIVIDDFRADLLLTNSQTHIPPILIEIYVSHKSTEKKLNSDYRIIEIHIESETDIDQIVSSASIIESDKYNVPVAGKENNLIHFYNFKSDQYEIPAPQYQPYKFRFWIDAKGYFQFDRAEDFDESTKCLSPNPSDIENSIFRIESMLPIPWDFAFYRLSIANIGVRYCTMCEFYRMNDYHMRSMCILYKAKGTKQYPNLSCAKSCPHFKQIDYIRDRSGIGTDYNQECNIIIRSI